MGARLLRSAFVVLLAAAANAVYSGRLAVPDRWNPWAPLNADEPLDWFTRYKLSRLTHDPALCLSVLTRANVRYVPVADRETGAGCGFQNAVHVESTPIKSVEPFTLSCRSTVALVLWERHSCSLQRP